MRENWSGTVPDAVFGTGNCVEEERTAAAQTPDRSEELPHGRREKGDRWRDDRKTLFQIGSRSRIIETAIVHQSNYCRNVPAVVSHLNNRSRNAPQAADDAENYGRHTPDFFESADTSGGLYALNLILSNPNQPQHHGRHRNPGGPPPCRTHPAERRSAQRVRSTQTSRLAKGRFGRRSDPSPHAMERFPFRRRRCGGRAP